MSDNITKRVGLGTAYGFAKAGGYEGTVAEFTELLGNIAIDLARIENLSVTVTTLPAGSQATASLNGSVLSLGIPKGDKGDKGNTGDTGAPAGFGTVSATVDANIGTPSVEVTASGADTAKNFAFAFHNLKGQKGDKGDTGEVSEAELAEALEDFSANGTVANAEQLTTDIRANDQTPYLFRTSGGSVDIGDREYINGIVGGTVAWNQLVQNGNFESTTGWGTGAGTAISVSNNKLSLSRTASTYLQLYISGDRKIKAIANHKYLFSVYAQSSNGKISLLPTGPTAGGQKVVTGATSDTNITWIYSPSEDAEWNASMCFSVITSGTEETITATVHDYCIFDLTQMFGSTIADYIYSLEQATAGAGVAWFRKLFPKPYYAYNAGELRSVSGLISHDMTGFNQWDEQWESGGIDADGVPGVWADRFRSKNYIDVLGNTAYCIYYGAAGAGTALYYYFYDADKNFISYDFTSLTTKVVTTPVNCRYMKIRSGGSNPQATYQNNICINLSWDGTRNGEYEPYVKHSYPLDTDLTLRGIPKLDANNKLYYDGDTYESDGTVTRKYGVVDLGTLNWTYKSSAQCMVSDVLTQTGSNGSIGSSDNVVCSKYATKPIRSYTEGYSDKQCGLAVNGTQLIVKDTTYSDATAFKTAMNGVYLVYELETPTTESADPYTSPQIVDDFGTEEYVVDDDVFAVLVGHDTDYPINLKAKLEMAPNSPEGNGDYIVRQTNGENSYVPLVIEDALPTIPSTAGSYKLTVTVTEGSDPVLSWTAE